MDTALTQRVCRIPSGWSYIEQSNQPRPQGLYAVTFRNEATREIVVAFQGTKGIGDYRDWLTTNQQIGRGIRPSEFDAAVDYVNEVKRLNPGYSITATGHSKGGANAQVAAAEAGVSAVTFGAPGVSALVNKLYPDASVVNYVNLGDPVTLIGVHVGRVETVLPVPGAFLLSPDYLILKSNPNHSLQHYGEQLGHGDLNLKPLKTGELAPSTLQSQFAEGELTEYNSIFDKRSRVLTETATVVTKDGVLSITQTFDFNTGLVERTARGEDGSTEFGVYDLAEVGDSNARIVYSDGVGRVVGEVLINADDTGVARTDADGLPGAGAGDTEVRFDPGGVEALLDATLNEVGGLTVSLASGETGLSRDVALAPDGSYEVRLGGEVVLQTGPDAVLRVEADGDIRVNAPLSEFSADGYWYVSYGLGADGETVTTFAFVDLYGRIGYGVDVGLDRNGEARLEAGVLYGQPVAPGSDWAAVNRDLFAQLTDYYGTESFYDTQALLDAYYAAIATGQNAGILPEGIQYLPGFARANDARADLVAAAINDAALQAALAQSIPAWLIAFTGSLQNALLLFTINQGIPAFNNGPADVTVNIIGFGATADEAAGILPLVIDLDGDGVALIPFTDSNARFDYDLDGDRDAIAWLSPGDGFLVLDRNANGRIDNAGEWFGERFAGPTAPPPGAASAGFGALATLATAGATRFDRTTALVDPATGLSWFDRVQVWRDLDGDGVTDRGELASLADLGIAWIGLNATRRDDAVAGSVIVAEAVARKAGGGDVLTVLDVSLGTETARADDPIVLASPVSLALINWVDQQRAPIAAGTAEAAYKDLIRGFGGLEGNSPGLVRAQLDSLLDFYTPLLQSQGVYYYPALRDALVQVESWAGQVSSFAYSMWQAALAQTNAERSALAYNAEFGGATRDEESTARYQALAAESAWGHALQSYLSARYGGIPVWDKLGYAQRIIDSDFNGGYRDTGLQIGYEVLADTIRTYADIASINTTALNIILDAGGYAGLAFGSSPTQRSAGGDFLLIGGLDANPKTLAGTTDRDIFVTLGGASRTTVEGFEAGAFGDVVAFFGSAAGATLQVGYSSASGNAGLTLSLWGGSSSVFLPGIGHGYFTQRDAAGQPIVNGTPLSLYDNLIGVETVSYANYTGGYGAFKVSLASAYDHTHLDGHTHVRNLIGSAGGDVLTGDAQPNTFTGGAGNDWLAGAEGADTLQGGQGRDTLLGGGGSDLIEGGTGEDLLVGWSGADIFYLRAAKDSPADKPDIIDDFRHAEGDRIDLSHLDADRNGPGSQPLVFLAPENAVFSGVVAARWFRVGADTRLEADLDGNRVADVATLLKGVSVLVAADLIL